MLIRLYLSVILLTELQGIFKAEISVLSAGMFSLCYRRLKICVAMLQ